MARPRKTASESAIFIVKARLYADDLRVLKELCEATGKSKTAILRESLRQFYKNVFVSQK
jgi:hypothetical protein